MKKHNFLFTGFFIAAIMLLTSPLFAVGIGGYLALGAGSYDWSYTDGTYYSEYDATTYDLEDSDVGSSVSKVGLGFILDTNIAKDSLFNYRLQISISSMTIDNSDSMEDMDIEATEFFVYNSFGFGVARTQGMRFWLGPQIGVGFISGEYNLDYETDTNEFIVFGANIGIVAGVNIHLTQLLSLAIDAGLRSNSLGGGMLISSGGDEIESSVTGSGVEFFANVGLLFRFGDQYSGYSASSSSSDDDIDLDIE